MNAPTPSSTAAWPDPAACLDHSLDVAGVIAATGCSEEDLADLGAIFLQELDNMIRRLQDANIALAADPAAESWPEAKERLRTAAHELTTSFGIVGARRAEAYARETQKRLRKTADPTGQLPEPTAPELRTAAAALEAAVRQTARMIEASAPA